MKDFLCSASLRWLARRVVLVWPTVLVAVAHAAPVISPAPQAFRQEVASTAPFQGGLPAEGIRLVDLAPDGTPLALARDRWFALRGERWEEREDLRPAKPNETRLLVTSSETVVLPIAPAQLRQIVRRGKLAWAVGDDAVFRVEATRSVVEEIPLGGGVRQFAVEPGGALWAASAGGLLQRTATGGSWQRVEISDRLGRVWGQGVLAGVAVDATGRVWVAGLPGVALREGTAWQCFDGDDGLPVGGLTSLAAGPDGAVWFGSRQGAVCWREGTFHYRQGPRWLPSDEIRSLVVDMNGSVWCATPSGVARIGFQAMTLAEKAAFFETEIDRYIRRTPLGYVAEARLTRPGDKSSAVPEDSDNDGLWTAMYGAGECFAYAATRDSAARDRAARVFAALRFLQTVTQGGSNSPPRGFVARSVRSTSEPDPNAGQADSDSQTLQHDRLWKRIYPRWPRSADGQWFWKCDTSSDELDGHYFFYPLYFDLCAETEAERASVQEVVRSLTDHLLAHDFALVDHDGRPTRWAVFGPRWLNADPTWWPERGINSLSILSYLAGAAHITGDAKYLEAFHRLVREHGYLQNVMQPKVQLGPGSGNQSDDEMAFMCFYTLLRYAPDEAVRQQVRIALAQYGLNEAPEMNPFFNFVWAAQSLGATASTPWGDTPVGPLDGWLEDSLATLRGLPLDRPDWSLKNKSRLDLRLLSLQANFDANPTAQTNRGGRKNGRVLPVENRHFAHWNTDPWQLDYGGGGGQLASGTVFLLPYYLGLYHGFISKP